MDPIVYWGAGAGTALLGYLFSFVATLFQARESRKQLELKFIWEKQQDLKNRQVEAVQRGVRYLEDRLRSAKDGIRLDLYYVHLDGLPVARQASEVDSLRQEAVARTDRHAEVALDLLLMPRDLDTAWNAAENDVRGLENAIAELKSEIFQKLYGAAVRKHGGRKNLNDGRCRGGGR